MSKIYAYPTVMPTPAREEPYSLPEVTVPQPRKRILATPEEVQHCFESLDEPPSEDVREGVSNCIAPIVYAIQELSNSHIGVITKASLIEDSLQKVFRCKQIEVTPSFDEEEGVDEVIIGNSAWGMRFALVPLDAILHSIPHQDRTKVYGNPIANILLSASNPPSYDFASQTITSLSMAFFTNTVENPKALDHIGRLREKVNDQLEDRLFEAFQEAYATKYAYEEDSLTNDFLEVKKRRPEKEAIRLTKERLDLIREELDEEISKKITDDTTILEQEEIRFLCLSALANNPPEDISPSRLRILEAIKSYCKAINLVISPVSLVPVESLLESGLYKGDTPFRNLIDGYVRVGIVDFTTRALKYFDQKIDTDALCAELLPTKNQPNKGLAEKIKETFRTIHNHPVMRSFMRPQFGQNSLVPADDISDAEYEKLVLSTYIVGTKLLEVCNETRLGESLNDVAKQKFADATFAITQVLHALRNTSLLTNELNVRFGEIMGFFSSLSFNSPFIAPQPELLELVEKYTKELLHGVGPYNEEAPLEETLQYWHTIHPRAPHDLHSTPVIYDDAFNREQVLVEGIIAKLLTAPIVKSSSEPVAKNGFTKKIEEQKPQHTLTVDDAVSMIRNINLDTEAVIEIVNQARKGFFASENEIRTTFGNETSQLTQRQIELLNELSQKLFPKKIAPLSGKNGHAHHTPELRQPKAPIPEPIIVPSYFETIGILKGLSQREIQDLLIRHPQIGDIKSDKVSKDTETRAELLFTKFSSRELIILLTRLPDFWKLTLNGSYDESYLDFAKKHFIKLATSDRKLRAARYKPIDWSSNDTDESSTTSLTSVSPEQTRRANERLDRSSDKNLIFHVLAMPDKSGFTEVCTLLEMLGCTDQEADKIMSHNMEMIRPHLPGTKTAGQFYFDVFRPAMYALGIATNERLGKDEDERIKHFLLDCPTAFRPGLSRNIEDLRDIFIEHNIEKHLTESVHQCKKLITYEGKRLRELIDKTLIRFENYNIQTSTADILRSAPHILFCLTDNEVRTEKLLAVAQRAIEYDGFRFDIRKLQQLFTLNPEIADTVVDIIALDGGFAGLEYVVERITKTQQQFIQNEAVYGRTTRSIIRQLRASRDEEDIRKSIENAYRVAFGEIRYTDESVV